MIEVRATRPADAESYWQCFGEVARESGTLPFQAAPPFEQVRAGVQQRRDAGLPCYVAVEDERVVGWGYVRREAPSGLEFPGMEHVGVLGLGVLVECRGQGLGRALVSRCLEHAPRVGLWRVGLQVFDSNASAVALYRSLGFQLEGRQRRMRRRNGVDEDQLAMAWFAPGEEPGAGS
ncbi:MAG: GNAT family N-acetyltransferase [Planctomycetota bacterium]|jgi:ribosomal protein S18 acetylase RimI-like enzyme